MAIFIGDGKNTTAARVALAINWCLLNVINPAILKQYEQDGYQLSHVIGIDTSPILACRIGVRNDNDLVWVGRAANYAAKLSSLNYPNSTFITEEVFDMLNHSSKFGGNPSKLMWQEMTWNQMNNMRIYRSTWTWGF
jgi:class 3 adenylate cyclase